MDLATTTAASAGVSFEPWQAGLVIVLCAFAALIANAALAVFNDGARPFMLDYIQGRSTRPATATIVFGLSAGFIFGLGAPMALSTGVLNPWLAFLPVEILGLLAPWRWLAAGAGALWGAVCVFGLNAANRVATGLPVDFISALQEISTPILWLFAIFPVLAITRQFGRTKGLVALVAEAAVIVASMRLWPDLFPGSAAMALGVILLLVFAVLRDRAAKRAETAELAAKTEEERRAHEERQAATAAASDQLFGPSADRLRRNAPWLAVLGGLVAALAASGVFGGGEATSFLVADGSYTEAAQVDFLRAFGFVPLIATTALASGAYAMAGFTFVYPVGYLVHVFVDSWPLAMGAAFVLGAVVMAAEVYLLSALGRWLQRRPSIRDAADHIRAAITESLSLAILVGSLMAGLAMGEGLGIALVGGLYLFNESLGRPVVRMAAGPTAVIAAGIVLNLLHLVGLFTPAS
ncbi:YhfT family protein [Streptomonospora nanhaiensis]|uniref:YhfT family protein n=1 Tax=Streptomonospora nanhaiensis TaxID=1323731 RepID=UPI001C3935B1|nr:YhfT family protein [Streptomonospora nanhaiensis]MBV2364537.1 YhfT family protein [Streptomonospora nanhaiensis]